MLVTGIYVTIDGIFVGHILGQDGLAGMMLAYPICAVLYAVGPYWHGILVAGLLLSGQGEQARARHIVGNALVMVLIASALLAFIGIRYGKAMLVWMGAQGSSSTQASPICSGTPGSGCLRCSPWPLPPCCATTGDPASPPGSWWGGVLNVLLDYLLMAVIPWGLAGPPSRPCSPRRSPEACACGTSSPPQPVAHSLGYPGARLAADGETLRLGVSSFLMYLYLSVVLALHNKALLSVGTSLHVAAYGVISYSEAFFYLIFEGIAMGIQPIASFNAGAGNWARVLRVRNLALGVTMAVALCGMIPLYLWPEAVVYLFAGTMLPCCRWRPSVSGSTSGAAHGRLAAGGGHLLPGHQPGPHRFPAHRRQAGADRRFPVGLLLPCGSGRCLAGAAHLQHSAGPGDVAGDEQGGRQHSAA